MSLGEWFPTAGVSNEPIAFIYSVQTVLHCFSAAAVVLLSNLKNCDKFEGYSKRACGVATCGVSRADSDLCCFVLR